MATPMQGGMSGGPPPPPNMGPGPVPISGPIQGGVNVSNAPPGPPQGQPMPSQMNTTELKFDNVAKVKSLVWSLKEILSNVIKVAASNIHHTAAVDNGVRATEDAPVRFDKSLEDFFSICNQIELNLRTIQECALQLRDSHQYLPVQVSPSTAQENALSYSQYINTIKAQVTFAKAVQEVLNDGARKITQGE